MTLEDFERTMAVHYWGPLYAMLAVLPSMLRRGTGRIVNIASIGGLIGVPHLIPYCASKFALVGLSQAMRAELLPKGIHITTVCPGLMRTGSHVNAEFKGQHALEAAWFSAGASAPLLAMDAQRAAQQILRACQAGRAHVVLSPPAKMAALVHGIAPGLTADTLSLVNRLLPGVAPGSNAKKGREARPDWMPRWVTKLGDEAALRNNEQPAAE
jgi:short-subunit dehydrogenase